MKTESKTQSKTNSAQRTPFFKDLTDVQLCEEYLNWRRLLDNANGIATMHAQVGARRSANRAVASVFTCQKNCDLILAIARKRGFCPLSRVRRDGTRVE